MTRQSFTVTRRHIENGRKEQKGNRARAYTCPVALCMRSYGYPAIIGTATYQLRVGRKQEMLPENLIDWINVFDAARSSEDFAAISEITFELDVPNADMVKAPPVETEI